MIDDLAAFLATHAPSIALVGFFTGFVLIFVLVMRPSKKVEMDEHARIPLKEKE